MRLQSNAADLAIRTPDLAAVAVDRGTAKAGQAAMTLVVGDGQVAGTLAFRAGYRGVFSVTRGQWIGTRRHPDPRLE